MKRNLTRVFLVCLATYVAAIAGLAQENPAVVPSHRYNWWGARHLSVNERVKRGNVDLIFIGDSITHGWEGTGKELWTRYYSKRNAVNMGFSGDRTQHVLWRLDNGNIDGISPRVAVVMIGTNNLPDGRSTVEQAAAGVEAIVTKLRVRLPATKILLLAIFPRDHEKTPLRQRVDDTNTMIRKLADGKAVHWLNINDGFLDEGGLLPEGIMPDFLHPNEQGYKIWAEAMEPTLAELMGDSKQ